MAFVWLAVAAAIPIFWIYSMNKSVNRAEKLHLAQAQSYTQTLTNLEIIQKGTKNPTKENYIQEGLIKFYVK
jgi:hypothetical protein